MAFSVTSVLVFALLLCLCPGNGTTESPSSTTPDTNTKSTATPTTAPITPTETGTTESLLSTTPDTNTESTATPTTAPITPTETGTTESLLSTTPDTNTESTATPTTAPTTTETGATQSPLSTTPDTNTVSTATPTTAPITPTETGTTESPSFTTPDTNTDSTATPTTAPTTPTETGTTESPASTTPDTNTESTVTPTTPPTTPTETGTTESPASTTPDTNTESTATPTVQTDLTTPLTSLPTVATSNPTTQSTVKPHNCLNGGTFNGYNCTCLVGFSGKFCELVVEVSSDNVNRSVMVSMEIKEKYDPKYDDITSPAYKTFVETFTEKMNKYYKKIRNFKTVVVTRVSRGGTLLRLLDDHMEEIKLSADDLDFYTFAASAEAVKVIHNVVLELPNDKTSEGIYEKDLEQIEKEVEGLLTCKAGTDCPYNVIITPNVTPTTVDLEGFCDNILLDKDIAEYYEAEVIDGKITCITVCNAAHKNTKTCSHNGVCRVYRDIGPSCECNSVNTTWYLGNDCAMPIQKTVFYVGLSITLACLLTLIAVLTAYVVTNRHKQAKTKEIKQKLVNEWLNDDYEWSKADYLNHLSKGQGNPHYQSGIAPQMFGIASQPTDMYVSEWITNGPSLNGAHGPTNGFGPGLPMRINRPRIRASSDV